MGGYTEIENKVLCCKLPIPNKSEIYSSTCRCRDGSPDGREALEIFHSNKTVFFRRDYSVGCSRRAAFSNTAHIGVNVSVGAERCSQSGS